MTTVPLSLVINRTQAIVRLAGIPAPFSGSLASNIAFVQFDEDKGGALIYNDRPQLPEAFDDPSPYQVGVNDWITAMGALVVNPLTLAQAKAVKCAFILAIGNAKKKIPVSVSVSGTPYQWTVAGNEALFGSQAWVAPLNNVISLLNDTAAELNAFSTADAATHTQFNIDSTNFVALNTLTGSLPIGTLTASALGSLTPLTAPPLSALPYGGTTPVTLTIGDVFNIISALGTQSSNTQVSINTKQNAVNALTTIAAVAAYDATTGW